MKHHYRFSFAATLWLLLFSNHGHGYSYAAAGKEPLLDGWIVISQAINAGQPMQAQQQLDELTDEMVEMESEADIALLWRLQAAVSDRDLGTAGEVFSDIFSIIIEQRLQLALQHIDDYQLAKVRVAKSKRYVDLLLNDIDLLANRLPMASRQATQQAIADCMTALGHPGLFGAGRQAADRAAFEQALERLLRSLVDRSASDSP